MMSALAVGCGTGLTAFAVYLSVAHGGSVLLNWTAAGGLIVAVLASLSL